MRKHITLPGALVAASLIVPSFAWSGGTRIWELAGYDDLEKGETDGTHISSIGEVALGHRAQKLAIEGVGLVWSALKGKGGERYLGTGYDGKVFRVKDKAVQEIASTGQLIVTSMVEDKKGDLFLSTLPDAVIWKVEHAAQVVGAKPVQAKKWVELPKGTLHVWALAFSRDENTLFAATGPEGKLFAIGRDQQARVYLDTEEEHLLSIAVRQKGDLLVGTSPGALLLEVSGPGKFSTLADFDATEVKAICADKGAVVAAVNTFAKPPSVPTKPTGAGDQEAEKGSSTIKKQTREAGDGQIFRISAEGRVEQIWSRKKAHIVSLAVSEKEIIYAGLGTKGTVLSIDEHRIVSTELDLDERQVMALAAEGGLSFAATGDAGAAYTVSRALPADARYLTPPLDAKAAAIWGRVKWFARGKLVVASRSGNTANPNKSWSDWSKPLTLGDLVESGGARYIQFRLSWSEDAAAELISLELAYRKQNLRAVIEEFDPGSPYPKTKDSSESEESTSERTIAAWPDARNEAELALSWKVDNPDGDVLRYRLWYRALGAKLWRPITRNDEIHRTKTYTWNTETIPEGSYQIRLVADDSPSNDGRDVLTDEYVSVPVLVDNHQPIVQGLAFAKGMIRGVAEDSFSAVSGLEYAVDDDPWMPVTCKDGIFDETKEEFEFPLPADLTAGPHAVAVRAIDRASNIGVSEIHIEVAELPKKRGQ